MTLVDTSVWIDHLRSGVDGLSELLEAGEVLVHSFVIGELACGHLPDRARTLDLLRLLPATPVADEDEILHFIDQRGLDGRGVGYVDVHLLASARLAGAQLWTRDRALSKVYSELRG
ncbi:MAG: putative nucleic acid-binding protein [Rhodothermales bacterium]|jgi:predicted nucleic acid-binding protein